MSENAVGRVFNVTSGNSILTQKVQELSDTKADKGSAISITIPTSGWNSDSTVYYSEYYDIAVTGVTTSDRASVDIAPSSMSCALSCRLCPVTETLTGKIRIRAVSVPTNSMTANYWIDKGV